MQLPIDLETLRNLEGNLPHAAQFFQLSGVSSEVPQTLGMLQREEKWLFGGIKTDDPKARGKMFDRTEQSQRVCGRAEPDIPDGELARTSLDPFNQAELPHVERFGFGSRSNDGMKGLLVFDRSNTMGAIRELNELIASTHGMNLAVSREKG